MSEVPLYRREAARLLPTVTALEEKNVFTQLDGQTLLDSTATTSPLTLWITVACFAV